VQKKRPFVPWTVVVLAIASSVVAFIVASAGAANPGEGTVTSDAPMLSWQGQEYAEGLTSVPNDRTAEVACAVPSDDICDHFELTVDLDEAHWEANNGGVEVSIIWESEEDDFDLYVFDGVGNTVGSSATEGGTMERVFIEDAAGDYQVRVVPWDVVDSGYMGGARIESRAKVSQGEVPTEPLSNVPCTDGKAGPFPCSNVDLESFLPNADIGGGDLNDIWGWTDPQTGKEYAIVGRVNGTSFVDISDPQAPKYLGNLPSHQSIAGQPVETIFNTWRDMKVYKDHAFIVSEEPLHGMQVFDLTRLRDVKEEQTFTEDGHYSFILDGTASFLDTDPTRLLNPPDNAHNIAINEESGFAYAIGTSTCGGGGPHMIDIRDPKNPAFAGCVSEDGYTHDNQCVNYTDSDPDPNFAGREICFNSNEDTLTIVDVTDKENPVQLARVPYEGAAYTHQGWLTEDRRFFLVDDELDEQGEGGQTRTYVFNVESLKNPTYVATYNGQAESIDHNQYVKGNRSYQANYRSGLRILDVTNVESGLLEEKGFFDVYPEDDVAEFNGAWSNFPYFESGIVVVSGIEQGLFVLRPHTGGSGEVAASSTGSDIGTAEVTPPAASPGATQGTGTTQSAGGKTTTGQRTSDANAARRALSAKPRVARKVRVNRKGKAHVTVICPAQKPKGSRTVVTKGARCTGRLAIRARGKRVGRKKFSVAAGERAVYRVKLRRSATASKAVRRKAKVKLRATRADGRRARKTQRVVLVFRR
jgi:choice-of-anchor B domain-containing protein